MTKLTALFLCFLLLFSLGSATVAWFALGGSFLPPISATAAAHYFESGTGTKDDPFIISAPIHLYNLSWLQNKGVFNETDENGKQISHYFKLKNDIDMYNGSAVTGAVPPIGTTDQPFWGYFDGNGKTIANLWVSSDYNDWEQKPDNAASLNVGSDVGMFGKIAKNDDDATYVGNFYLQNVQVTTNVATCNVGIVAGTLDASMSLVGVVNAKIVAKQGVNITSDYSLVGKTGATVSWPDAPSDIGQGGGDLTIQPNNTVEDSPYYIYKAFSQNDTGTGTLLADKVEVPGSASGMAYIYNTVTRVTINGGLKGVNYYNNTDLTYQNGVTIGGTSDGTGFSSTLPTNATEEQQFFAQEIGSSGGFALHMGGKPQIVNGSTSTTLANGVTYNDSSTFANCVWFNPQAAGKCALAFLHQSNNTTDHMSVYRFKRSASNTITDLQEMSFELNKTNGNKKTTFYILNLSESDLGYEYVIGVGSDDTANNAEFYYMMLAGSDQNSGSAMEGTARILEKIDFLPEVPTTTDTDAIFAAMHLPVLAINYNATATVSATEQNFYFEAKTSDNLVHYFTDGNVTMTEVAKPSSGNGAESSASGFTPIRP